MTAVWTLFPHVSIAEFDAGGKLYMISQLFPGRSADESITIQNFLATDEPTEEHRGRIDTTMKFLELVVREEDYFTGNGIPKGVKTGAKSEVLFGRNEAGGQRFHRWVEALIRTDDDQLPQRFAEGVAD